MKFVIISFGSAIEGEIFSQQLSEIKFLPRVGDIVSFPHKVMHNDNKNCRAVSSSKRAVRGAALKYKVLTVHHIYGCSDIEYIAINVKLI